jgi:Bacteriophage head to tail connecting protein
VAAKPDQIKRRGAELKAEKQPHQEVWKSCADLTFPARAHGLDNQIINATDAQQRKAVIYDSTPGDSCKVGAATIMGSMVPSSAQWFGLDIGESSNEEDTYLEEFAKFIWTNIHGSNFDAEAMDALLDAMWCGWFVLYADEAPDGGFYFELWPVGQCSIASSRSGSVIDTVYREWEYTVSQTVAEYGIDQVSQKVRDAFNDSKFDQKVRLMHSIEPRALYVVGSQIGTNLPFSSCHIEVESGQLLREGGYHEFPCMVPRWARVPASAYATGPMGDALADARTLNEVVKYTLMGAETAIAPMLKVVDDGVINAKNIRMGPRKVLVCADPDNIQPLNTGAKVEAGILTAERLQASIRKMLFADQLPPADGPVKTAYEWSVRVETMRRILGPMFSRFQSEFLNVMITRLFGIAWRANIRSGFSLVGQPPDTLLGRNFSVKYQSPHARAQRMDEVDAMDRYEMALRAEAEVDPSVLDVYDMDAAARERSKLLGVPQRLMNDPKKTTQIRKARAEAQAKAEERAMEMNGQAEQQAAMGKRLALVA